MSQCWEHHCASPASIVRAPLREPFHQRDPGSISASTLYEVEFDISLLCRERFYPPIPVFPSHKNKTKFDLICSELVWLYFMQFVKELFSAKSTEIKWLLSFLFWSSPRSSWALIFFRVLKFLLVQGIIVFFTDPAHILLLGKTPIICAFFLVICVKKTPKNWESSWTCAGSTGERLKFQYLSYSVLNSQAVAPHHRSLNFRISRITRVAFTVTQVTYDLCGGGGWNSG